MSVVNFVRAGSFVVHGGTDLELFRSASRNSITEDLRAFLSKVVEQVNLA